MTIKAAKRSARKKDDKANTWPVNRAKRFQLMNISLQSHFVPQKDFNKFSNSKEDKRSEIKSLKKIRVRTEVLIFLTKSSIIFLFGKEVVGFGLELSRAKSTAFFLAHCRARLDNLLEKICFTQKKKFWIM